MEDGEVQVQTIEQRLADVIGRIIVDNAKLGFVSEELRVRGQQCAAQLQGTQDALDAAKRELQPLREALAAAEPQLQEKIVELEKAEERIKIAEERAQIAEARVKELEQSQGWTARRHREQIEARADQLEH